MKQVLGVMFSWYMVCLIVMAIGITGCTAHQHVTPVDKSLSYWNQYDAFEMTYKSQMTAAQTEEERELLASTVGVALDNVRPFLILYSQSLQIGEPDEAARIEIVNAFRQMALQLWRVE